MTMPTEELKDMTPRERQLVEYTLNQVALRGLNWRGAAHLEAKREFEAAPCTASTPEG